MSMFAHICCSRTGFTAEIGLIQKWLARYGVTGHIIHTTRLPTGNTPCIVLGEMEGLRQMATARPINLDGRKVIRVPGMAMPYAKRYKTTLSYTNRAAAIAARYVSGAPAFEIPCKVVSCSGNEVDKAILILTNQSQVQKRTLWLDIETTGFDPFTCNIVTAAVWPEGADTCYVFNDHFEELFAFLCYGARAVSACNAKFEQRWCWVKFHTLLPLESDAMVDYALLYEEFAKGLEHIAGTVDAYGYEMEMLEFLEPLKGHRLVQRKDRPAHWQAPVALLNRYCASDTVVAGLASNKLVSLIKKSPGRMMEVRDWLVRGQTMLARMEAFGMKLSPAVFDPFVLNMENDLINLRVRLEKIGRHYMGEFNPGAATQRSQLLYDHLGYPVYKLTNDDWCHPSEYAPGWWQNRKKPFWMENDDGPSSPSSDGEALDILVSQYPDDPILKDFRQFAKLQAVYDGLVQRCETSIRETNGYVRSDFDLTKLVTGQLTSTNPPLLNVAKTDIRTGWVSRFDGGYVGEFDYSQLHLRIIGNLAQCPGFIDAYLGHGTDLHSQVAAALIAHQDEQEYLARLKAGDDEADKARDKGKRVNFSIIFEIGPRALSMKLIERPSITKVIITRWFERFPAIKEQIERQHAFAEKHGYVVSPFGRVRHLPGAQSPNRSTRLRSLRQAGDYYISNAGRYTMLYGMIMLDEEMHFRGMKSGIMLQVHDSLAIDIHPDEKDEVLELVHSNCVVKMAEMTADWMDPIPLVMEGFLGPSWYKKAATHKIYMDPSKLEVKEAK